MERELKRIKNRITSNKGFSLTELIIVIAIMAILAALVAPSVIRYIDKSREQRALNDCQVMVESITFAQIANELPSNSTIPIRTTASTNQGGSYALSDFTDGRSQSGVDYEAIRSEAQINGKNEIVMIENDPSEVVSFMISKHGKYYVMYDTGNYILLGECASAEEAIEESHSILAASFVTAVHQYITDARGSNSEATAGAHSNWNQAKLNSVTALNAKISDQLGTNDFNYQIKESKGVLTMIVSSDTRYSYAELAKAKEVNVIVYQLDFNGNIISENQGTAKICRRNQYEENGVQFNNVVTNQ